jgi:hypothetical protein
MSDIESSYRDYKDLINKVKRLTPKEKHHILSIFKKYNIDFTKNSNGYFFNLDTIEPHIIDKVSKCVDLIEQKRELIFNLDKKRDHYLEYYKTLIESKLKETINKKREQYINKLILIPIDTYISKKKPKFNRVIITGDPDVLMKEHLKSKKYHKNSVYYRLTQTMNYLSRKHGGRSRIVKDEGDNEGDSGSFNYGNGDGDSGSVAGGGDIGGGIGSDFEEGIDADEDIEESVDPKFDDDEHVGDDEDNDSSLDGNYNDNDNVNDEHSDIDDNEYYKDSSSDVETNDMKTDKTERSEKTTKTNKTKKTKHTKKKKSEKTNAASSNEIDYYKQLLKQNGYVFREDKIILNREEYIV